MVYLDFFKFVTGEAEDRFFTGEKMTCYDTYYPFQIFPYKGLKRLDFDDITILYGGNGSGKSTALNLIADKISAERDTAYNRSNFFEEYLELCEMGFQDSSYEVKTILSSDGVFDRMIDLRQLNEHIDTERDRIITEYEELKAMQKYPNSGRFSKKQLEQIEEIKSHPLENFDQYKKLNMVRSKTRSKYVRRNVADNVRERSNGESAFEYFVSRIDKAGIYILDEPENSLSPKLQLELVQFIRDSVRYFGSQFIIATHSPFVLSIPGAKIYDLDAFPVDIKNWTELENVRAYYDFFMKHSSEF